MHVGDGSDQPSIYFDSGEIKFVSAFIYQVSTILKAVDQLEINRGHRIAATVPPLAAAEDTQKENSFKKLL